MNDIPVVYATTTANVNHQGAQYTIQGGAHWYADDPLVRENPNLFSTDARYGMKATVTPTGLDPLTWERLPSAAADAEVDERGAGSSADRDAAPAEQATAAPGEKRPTSRGRAATA